jgi:hypothetical protein
VQRIGVCMRGNPQVTVRAGVDEEPVGVVPKDYKAGFRQDQASRIRGWSEVVELPCAFLAEQPPRRRVERNRDATRTSMTQCCGKGASDAIGIASLRTVQPGRAPVIRVPVRGWRLAVPELSRKRIRRAFQGADERGWNGSLGLTEERKGQ